MKIEYKRKLTPKQKEQACAGCEKVLDLWAVQLYFCSDACALIDGWKDGSRE